MQLVYYMLLSTGFLLERVVSKYEGCRCIVFQSYAEKLEGEFRSPGYPTAHPRMEHRCFLYVFIADEGQIIKLTFHEFQLQHRKATYGCVDFVRLFLNLDRPELSPADFHNFELCGTRETMQQSTFYSSHRAIILQYVSKPNSTHTMSRFDTRGFKGNYTFLRRNRYQNSGNLQDYEPCTWRFQSITQKEGVLFSPRYPQNYPNNVICWYNFYGLAHEKVVLDLHPIELHHSGKKKCHRKGDIDRMTVYDGEQSSSPRIGIFCGITHKVQLVSSGPILRVKFESNDDGMQLGGFAGKFSFHDKNKVQSSRALNNIIYENEEEEPYKPQPRELVYQSRDNARSGIVTSPSWNEAREYPPNVDYTYKFVGQTNEVVVLTFQRLILPRRLMKKCRDVSNDSDSVIVYDGLSDTTRIIGRTCDLRVNEPMTSSTSNIMVMFHSDNIKQIHMDKLGYSFRYAFTSIQPDEEENTSSNGANSKKGSNKCPTQTYDSKNRKSGRGETPRYGGNYPRSTTCRFVFKGDKAERIIIRFKGLFDLGGYRTLSKTNLRTCNKSDVLRVQKFETDPDTGLDRILVEEEYCGSSRPPQIMSARRSRIDLFMVSGPTGGSRGFQFVYSFVTNFGIVAPNGRQKNSDCIFHFRRTEHPNGSFTSPNYPGKYPQQLTCDYRFYGSAKDAVNINFEEFRLEGSPNCDMNTASDYIATSSCNPYEGGLRTGGERRYCGSAALKRRTIAWPESCLLLRFHSNNRFTQIGFFAYYEFRHSQSRRYPPSEEISTNRSVAGHITTTIFVIMCVVFQSNLLTHL